MVGYKFFKNVRQSDRLKLYKDVFEELKKKFNLSMFWNSRRIKLKRKIQLKQGKPPIYDRSSLKLGKKNINDLISNGKSPHWRLN